MLLLCHLFLGLLLGVVTGYLLSDKKAIIFVLIGTVLPDIIDKPLGHIFLMESIGDGRIFCHSIFFFLFIAVTGILAWKVYGSTVILYLALGILFHQLTDAMWMVPVHWFWPVLGPYPLHTEFGEGYFTSQFLREITSVSEWVFLIVLIFLATAFLMENRDRSGLLMFNRYKPVFSSVLFAMGIFSIWFVYMGEWDYTLGYVFPENIFTLAIVSFAGFASILIYGDALFSFAVEGKETD